MKRLSGMLYGAFVGDAFSLSSHWIYDTEKLAIEFSNQTAYTDPAKNLFHAGKHKGDLTHYGDQSLLLLKSISSNKGFHLPTFKTHWINYMKHYEGYMDHASKIALEQLDSNTHLGSSSDELGGFSRCAPLLFYHFDDPLLLKYIADQTKLTHNDQGLVEIAEFITRWVLELIIGKPLKTSFETLLAAYPAMSKYGEMALKHMDDDTTEAIKDIGQSCSSQYAFPAALLILFKHPTDFLAAMQANIMAGGDSAGRGAIIGMVLGASLGVDQIPEHLIKTLSAHEILATYAKHHTV